LVDKIPSDENGALYGILHPMQVTARQWWQWWQLQLQWKWQWQWQWWWQWWQWWQW
jgi:hypothetical protein